MSDGGSLNMNVTVNHYRNNFYGEAVPYSEYNPLTTLLMASMMNYHIEEKNKLNRLERLDGDIIVENEVEDLKLVEGNTRSIEYKDDRFTILQSKSYINGYNNKINQRTMIISTHRIEYESIYNFLNEISKFVDKYILSEEADLITKNYVVSITVTDDNGGKLSFILNICDNSFRDLILKNTENRQIKEILITADNFYHIRRVKEHSLTLSDTDYILEVNKILGKDTKTLISTKGTTFKDVYYYHLRIVN
jgi:hypothetical protein